MAMILIDYSADKKQYKYIVHIKQLNIQFCQFMQ